MIRDRIFPSDFVLSHTCSWIHVGIHVVGKGNWKQREVGKFEVKLERMKLESSSRKLKSSIAVEKFSIKLKRSIWVRKLFLELESFPCPLVISNFSHIIQTVAKLSNFSDIFPLRSVLSNINRNFLISDFPAARSFQLPFPMFPSYLWNDPY